MKISDIYAAKKHKNKKPLKQNQSIKEKHFLLILFFDLIKRKINRFFFGIMFVEHFRLDREG